MRTRKQDQMDLGPFIREFLKLLGLSLLKKICTTWMNQLPRLNVMKYDKILKMTLNYKNNKRGTCMYLGPEHCLRSKKKIKTQQLLREMNWIYKE